jgi:hypothetical protein
MKRLIRKVEAAKPQLMRPLTQCPSGCGSYLYDDGNCSNPNCSNSKEVKKKEKKERKVQVMNSAPNVSQLDDNDDSIRKVEFHFNKIDGTPYGEGGVFMRNRTESVDNQVGEGGYASGQSWIQYVFYNQIHYKLNNGEIPLNENRVASQEFVEKYRNGEIDPTPVVKRFTEDGLEV